MIKRLAVALTASQIFTQPDLPKTHFDPQTDQAEVVRIMNAGCTHIMGSLGAEFPDFQKLDIDQLLDVLNATIKAPSAPQVDVNDVRTAYALFCKGQTVENSEGNISTLINFYNNAMKDLPDPMSLKGMRLPEINLVLDEDGKPFTEAYTDNNRRRWVSLKDIPDMVQKAFIAAEDKRFFEHHGVDERGVIRAAITNASGTRSREQGGSTITQQVVKNLLVGDDLTFERKMREMVVANQLERVLSKKEILELYINMVFLGRASWGIEMAAQTYFGKSISKVNLTEAAFLAGLPKGPNYFNPDRYPDRALARVNYVLGQMKDAGYIAQAEPVTAVPPLIAYENPRSRGGFYFVSELMRNFKTSVNEGSGDGPPTIQSTIRPALQAATEGALQEGLAQYEIKWGRAHLGAPEGNLRNAVGPGGNWKDALQNFSPPLYDVRWPLAVVLSADRNGYRVGLKDGRMLSLSAWNSGELRKLKIYDVVFVQLNETNRGATAELRFRPKVQGATMVMENTTGRVVAMVGGFSYAASPLNRAVHAIRQPGSSIKPVTYAVALNSGLQPNTLMPDAEITIPPLEKGAHYWSPFNYERGGDTITTLRRALENSRNRVTARLLYAITPNPPQSLDMIRDLMKECGAHPEPPRHYAIILGGIDVTMLNMAACYATIANLGYRPQPHLIDSVISGNKTLFSFPENALTPITKVDGVTFYQLRSLMQGVIKRGTAYRVSTELANLSPGEPISNFIAGKTGTSQQQKDAWFMGFTNDITIAVWVGYDNNKGVTNTLGNNATGAGVAAPIFERVLRQAVGDYPLTRFAQPPSSIAGSMRQVPVELESGRLLSGMQGRSLPNGVILENFRADPKGYAMDTWQKVTGYRVSTAANRPYEDDGGYYSDSPYRQVYRPSQQQGYFPYFFGGGNRGYGNGYGQGYGNPWGYGGAVEDPSQRYRRQPQRVDPDYGYRWR